MAEGGALRELLAIFKLDLDDEGLKRGQAGIQGLLGKVKEAGRVMADAFGVKLFADFIRGQIGAAAHVQDLSERLGIGADDLNRFGKVAAGAGVDLDQAAHVLGHLNRTMGEAAMGGGEAGKNFAALGVSLKDANGSARPMMDVLGDVSDGLAKLPNQAERTAYAMKLFGREGRVLLPILGKGKEALAEELAEAKRLSSGLGNDYFENAKRARTETARFNMAIGSVKSRITAEVLPYVLKLAKGAKELAIRFLDFTKKTTVLKTGLMALGAVMAYRLIGTFTSVLRILGLLGPTIGATAAAVWAFVWPIALVGLLYVAFDDLFALMRGGNSVIGRLVDSMFGLGTGAKLGVWLNAVLADSIRFFGDLWGIVAGFASLMVNEVADSIVAVGKALNDLAHGRFDKIGEDFTKGFDDLPARIAEIQKSMSDLTGGKTSALDRANGLMAAGVDPKALLATINTPENANLLTSEKNQASPNVVQQIGSGILARRATSALPPPATEAGHGWLGTPAVNQTNTTNVTVHTSSDNPQDVGKAVGSSVATTQEKANNNAMRSLVRQ